MEDHRGAAHVAGDVAVHFLIVKDRCKTHAQRCLTGGNALGAPKNSERLTRFITIMAKTKKTKRPLKPLPRIGWREWVCLPELGVPAVKAKIDTGARSSSLHAFDVRVTHDSRGAWVYFNVHPIQRDNEIEIQCVAPLLERRSVRSSSGHSSERPVILTDVQVGDEVWPIEITLTNRDEMGFRMLLGREAVRKRYLVDAGRSYLQSDKPKFKRKKKITKKKSKAKRTSPKGSRS